MRTISPELEALLRSRFQAAGSGYAARFEVDSPIAPAASILAKDATWKYLIGAVGHSSGFEAPAFDDSSWPTAPAPFGSPAWTPGTDYTTDWLAHPSDICMRRWVWFPEGAGTMTLVWYVDYSGDLYINGSLLDHHPYTGASPATSVLGTWTPGWNLIAIRGYADPPGTNLVWATIDGTGLIHMRTVYQPERIGLNKNLRMGPDQASVALRNENVALGFGPTSIFPTNSRCRIYQWLGDPGDAVLTFTGVIDKVDDSRDPLITVLTCRSLAGTILVDQTFSTTAPQAADESGADRTEDNGVYLAREVDYVVADRLTRAGWPADLIDIADTTFVLDEFIVDDGATEWDTLARLAAFVGYTLWDDEDGWIHFATIGARASVDNTLVADYEYEIGAA